MRDRDYRREFGSAIRAAEGMPDEDGTLPLVLDRRIGQWGIVSPSPIGNAMILAAAFAAVSVLIWLAAR